MAILNIEKNQIVIRLVYDGAPLSGKTTSLKALAGSFSEELYTPEELYGRTTYFDWIEYVGGLFEGYQLCCQIVSVPGQLVWAKRRRQLIDSADVIVFVGDTTRNRFHDSLAYLQNLTQHLQDLEGPPVGIVFQANKRDLEDIVGIQEIEQRLGESLKGVAIVESVATESSGVRHAFVLGVRLCLDRVRELIKTNALVQGKPEIENGRDLLQAMKARETDKVQPDNDVCLDNDSQVSLQLSPASQMLSEVLVQEPQAVEFSIASSLAHQHSDAGAQTLLPQVVQRQIPQLPSPDVASGMVWPPIEGRIILHEISADKAELYRTDDDDWFAISKHNWLIYSYKESVFYNLEQARQQLIYWAHLHLPTLSLLSPRRCLVLTGTAEQGWRLWQVVRKTESLRDYVDKILAGYGPEKMAEGLWEATSILITAAEKFATASCSLPCRLETVSRSDSHIFYNSLMPNPAFAYASSSGLEGDWAKNLIQEQLTPVLREAFAYKQSLLPAVIEHLRLRADISNDLQRFLNLLAAFSKSNAYIASTE